MVYYFNMQREDGILVFAGYDPTGGAGILQDTYLIRRKGIYVFAIQTAMVYENTCRVDKVFPMDIDMQINLAMEENTIFKVFKLGLIHSKRQLESILFLAKKLKPKKIIIDPIFYSTSQGILTRLSKEDYLYFIQNTNSLLIPNKDEFNILFWKKDPKDAAITFKTDILIKTYNTTNSHIVDLLATKEGNIIEFVHKKLYDHPIHGTGCTISSILATYLMETNDIKKAYLNTLKEYEDMLKKTITLRCQKIIF